MQWGDKLPGEVRLVWRTDVHHSDRTPGSRTDDWTSTVLDKLAQVGEIAREVQADAVLDGGDFFNIKSPSRNSHHLVAETAKVHTHYPCPVYANVGNHDCKYGDIAFLEEQPLGVLFNAGVFKRLYDEHELLIEQGGTRVRVVGIPYHGVSYDMERFRRIEKKEPHELLVVVAHVLASPAGGTMFEGEDIVKYSDLLELNPAADVWCFLPGTMVTDWNGRVLPIEEVSSAIALQGRNGPVVVEEVHPVRTVDEEIITFDVEGVPSPLIPGVTGEHPFWVAKNLRCVLPSRSNRRCHPDKTRSAYPCTECKQAPQVDAGWCGAAEVAVGDYVAIPYPKVPSDAISAPGLARLLGYYLAEGHILKNRNRDPVAGVVWSFHVEEHALQHDVAALVREHFGLDTKQYDHRKYDDQSVQIHAHGRAISEFFQEHGGQGSASKVMSSWVWRLSASSRMELLTGWLLGDGHARFSKVEVIGCTVSPSLASQLFLLALSLGLQPFYTIRPGRKNSPMPKGKVSDTLPAHIISFYGDDAESLSRRMGVSPPERSKTKVSGFFHDGMYWRRVRDVKRTHYNGPVYNMRTSTEEYVAGMLLTHNCFGHWHKDQGITELAQGKYVVNVGSLTRGSLSEDNVERIPSCVVMGFRGREITLEQRFLKVKPAGEVFDLVRKVRQESREMTIEAFVESLQDTLGKDHTTPLPDLVRQLNVPAQVKERALSYLESVS